MTTRRTRVVGTSLCTFVALGTLTSCLSQPSNRRVVQDQIEALDLPDDQERCMLDKVEDEGDYTDDQLKRIGDENESLDFADPTWVSTATPDMQEFVEDLNRCLDTTAVAEPTETTGTTEPTATTAPR